VACFPLEGELGLVCVAQVDQGDDSTKGQFFVTRSRERVHTWPPGEPLGETFDWDDGALSARVSADSRGRTLVISYPTLSEHESQPRLNSLVSTNFGVTWQRAGTSTWSSAGSAVAISPAEDRILFAAELEDPHRVKLRHQLLLKEFGLVVGNRRPAFPGTGPDENETPQPADEEKAHPPTTPAGSEDATDATDQAAVGKGEVLEKHEP
jgi:hypothetical protein